MINGVEVIMKKFYEMNSDYILDVLEEAATESVDKIFDEIEGNTSHEFSKLLAILSEIDNIKDKKRA